MIRRLGTALVPLIVALAPTSCGTSTQTGPEHYLPVGEPAPASTAPPAQTVSADAVPVSLKVPAIGVDATDLQPLGLKPDGTMQVPPLSDVKRVGWFTRGGHACVPGPAPLPAAMAAHIDGQGARGAFWSLASIKPGATITVGLSDKSTCTYRVTGVKLLPKANFNSAAVWAPVPAKTGRLVLISCGGAFANAQIGYSDNVVAYADLVS